MRLPRVQGLARHSVGSTQRTCAARRSVSGTCRSVRTPDAPIEPADVEPRFASGRGPLRGAIACPAPDLYTSSRLRGSGSSPQASQWLTVVRPRVGRLTWPRWPRSPGVADPSKGFACVELAHQVTSSSAHAAPLDFPPHLTVRPSSLVQTVQTTAEAPLWWATRGSG